MEEPVEEVEAIEAVMINEEDEVVAEEAPAEGESAPAEDKAEDEGVAMVEEGVEEDGDGDGEEEGDAAPPPPPEARPIPEGKPPIVVGAEESVAEDKWDTYSWLEMLGYAQTQSIEDARQTYEDFLAVYPSSGKWWAKYAQHELDAGNTEELWKILDRCLTQCPSLELYQLYLGYTVEAKKEDRKSVLEAYEFALKAVGRQLGSGQLWLNYIAFVKATRSHSPLWRTRCRRSSRPTCGTPSLLPNSHSVFAAAAGNCSRR